jgi:hypothetical protein
MPNRGRRIEQRMKSACVPLRDTGTKPEPNAESKPICGAGIGAAYLLSVGHCFRLC